LYDVVVIEQYLQEEKMPLIYRVKIKLVSWINPSLLEVTTIPFVIRFS
jgi:hypothetical protein